MQKFVLLCFALTISSAYGVTLESASWKSHEGEKTFNMHKRERTNSTPLPADAVPCLGKCGGSAFQSCNAFEKQECVLAMAKYVLHDFSAGIGYPNVWIRDANTFIEEALEAGMQHNAARNVLLKFLEQQEADGGIDDWVCMSTGEHGKNTVETDQETSLVQALYKYVVHTGDVAILHQMVKGHDDETLSVLKRLEMAFDYLKNKRTSSDHGLLYGATTVDWGDVQAQGDGNAILMEDDSHPAIDIYDNAMMLQALQDYANLCSRVGDTALEERYRREATQWAWRTREAMWNVQRQQWRPHVYFNASKSGTFKAGSPFPSSFDENKLYYHGGTTIAMLAGLNSKEEAQAAYSRMQSNVHEAGNGLTVGLTVWPPYPEGLFPMKPHWYQNAGDWPWFGARTVQALIKYGLLVEAREALTPIIDRTLKDKDFIEFYDGKNNRQGSRQFHGGAGAIATAIRMLRAAESTATRMWRAVGSEHNSLLVQAAASESSSRKAIVTAIRMMQAPELEKKATMAIATATRTLRLAASKNPTTSKSDRALLRVETSR